MVTFPLWFKIFLGCSLFSVILGMIKYFVRDKYVNAIVKLPTERKAKFLKSYVNMIKLYKLFFWVASPLYLVIPPLTYKYSPANFFHVTTTEIIIYIIILQNFLYRKHVVNKINLD